MSRLTTAYKGPGETLTLTAPYDRTAGQGAKVGALFGVAQKDVLETVEGEFHLHGEYTLDKTSAQAWVIGDPIYWDDTNKRCDNDSTVGMAIGVCTATAANPTSTGRLVLVPAGVATEGPQASIASFTMGTNITAATANDALTDSSGTNPTEAQFNELAKEVGTKVNAILAALRLAGIIDAP